MDLDIRLLAQIHHLGLLGDLHNVPAVAGDGMGTVRTRRPMALLLLLFLVGIHDHQLDALLRVPLRQIQVLQPRLEDPIFLLLLLLFRHLLFVLLPLRFGEDALPERLFLLRLGGLFGFGEEQFLFGFFAGGFFFLPFLEFLQLPHLEFGFVVPFGRGRGRSR